MEFRNVTSTSGSSVPNPEGKVTGKRAAAEELPGESHKRTKQGDGDIGSYNPSINECSDRETLDMSSLTQLARGNQRSSKIGKTLSSSLEDSVVDMERSYSRRNGNFSNSDRSPDLGSQRNGSDDSVFEVAAIEDYNPVDETYKVKWAGYDERTWEPWVNVRHVAPLKKYLRRATTKKSAFNVNHARSLGLLPHRYEHIDAKRPAAKTDENEWRALSGRVFAITEIRKDDVQLIEGLQKIETGEVFAFVRLTSAARARNQMEMHEAAVPLKELKEKEPRLLLDFYESMLV